MNHPKNKKKSPVIFFLLAFLAILIIIVVNRKSFPVDEIHFPYNSGIANLSTCEKFLVAVSLDNQIYVWDWNDLAKRPQIGSVQSSQAALLKSDVVASVRQDSPKALVLTNLQGDKEYKEILVDSNNRHAYLGVNRNRSTVAVLLAETHDSRTAQANYEVLLIDCDSGQIDPIVKVTEETNVGRLTNFAVSDDGEFIVAVGEKNDYGWIVLADVKQKRVVWEKQLPQPGNFDSVTFSLDGTACYVGGSDGTLYKIQTVSGKLLSQLPTAENNQTRLNAVVVSPDGRLVATTVTQGVFVRDCKTGRKIFARSTGHKIASSLVFSPDSRFLATSDLRQGGIIKIWRMPED